MKQFLTFLIAAGLSSATSMGQSWNSQLLPNVGGKYTAQAVNFAGRTWSLDDFSYAGYYLGTKSLGSVPCNVVNISATGDITQAVQAAVNTVGQAGGGSVRIPAGTFTMSAPVGIPYNNVSIEGAGSGQTIINVPSNFGSDDGANDGLFAFGRSVGAAANSGWVSKGSTVANVTTVVHRGDMAITVDSASKINVNDWIVIQQVFWTALTNNNSSNPTPWPANSCCEFSFTYLRQVTAKSGNQISIDAPIPWTLDPANNRVRVGMTDGQLKENVGLKGMTIQFANNMLASTGRPHGTGAYFEGVRNGWVYDVRILNFPRYGIYLNFSARITLLNCWVQTAQDKGGEGYGYGFIESPAQNILIKGSHGEDTRHNFITSHPQTSMIVQSQNVSVNEIDPDDTHYAFEQAIAWDKHIQMNGGAIEMVNRGNESGTTAGAWETLASGVVWNFYGDGVKNHLTSLNGALYLKPSPDGLLIVVGVNGAHAVYDNTHGAPPFAAGQRMQAAAGLQVGTSTGALKNVLYEGLYQSGLEPDSLYEAQLSNRIGVAPAPSIDVCVAAPMLNAGGIGNAASGEGVPLSPGEIVSLFGSGMGPATLTSLTINASGLVDNFLAGTRVLFDGSPAPLIFTSANQVAAVVPYATAGKPATQVQVEYLGQRSAAAAFPVAATSPGIFKLGDAGGGVGIWVVNQDGSLNSPANPAKAGDIVVFYATGAGQTNPPGVDGSIAAAPFPMPVQNVSVTIGGVQVSPLYAGAAPFEIAGLLQVNAMIPSGVAPSDAAPLVLTIGNAASQAGCTLAIH